MGQLTTPCSYQGTFSRYLIKMDESSLKLMLSMDSFVSLIVRQTLLVLTMIMLFEAGFRAEPSFTEYAGEDANDKLRIALSARVLLVYVPQRAHRNYHV
jgi:hypothetical protein